MHDEKAASNTNELRPLHQFCIGLMTLSVLLRSHLTISHDLFFEAFAGSCRLTLGVMMSQVPCVMPFDTVYGSEFDLIAHEHVLRDLIMLGMISFIWFGLLAGVCPLPGGFPYVIQIMFVGSNI